MFGRRKNLREEEESMPQERHLSRNLQEKLRKKDSVGQARAAEKTKNERRTGRRQLQPLEERQKRGRWLIPILLLLSILISYIFWLQAS